MERALVVVDDSERHRELVEDAGALAAGVGADLRLLTILSEEAYESDQETVATIASVEDISFDDDAVLESARAFLSELASDVLADVDYETIAAVADGDAEADVILDAADEQGCDHVFIVGAKRSPTGKAIFGDTTQSVILNFDGYVTVKTE